ncbi:hypothetical protein ANO14919_046530 [Xylariales sp. No.14919]|nr:hypothetical protein ANO14919_046530 [Xylariales sp. No.14919]
MTPLALSVSLVFSLPGDTKSGIFGFNPAPMACLASEAARDISSNEEFVQEPISPAVSFFGQSFSRAAFGKSEIGVDRSGVNGPLIRGSREDKSMLITLSYSTPSSARSAWAAERRAPAMSWRYVAFSPATELSRQVNTDDLGGF